ncbi:MAG: signal recognition particle protein [Candidatus Cloacimonetes bacterium 4572_55]|nr:MAG: signal recognition particle protein [Candidatus Cloacimonetes bacterium 4572_55]
MFGELTEKLNSIFKHLKGRGKLNKKNIEEALKAIRRALLEADVNYRVTKKFVNQVKERAVGQEVLKSITPGQMVVKIVHDELISLLGQETKDIKMASQPPTIIMMVGLQGSGKTTMAGKLARYFKSKGKLPFMIAGDVYRPAAIDQLQILGKSIDVPVFTISGSKNVVKICQKGIADARRQGRNIVFIDTAGRLHIDEKMMDEVSRVKKAVNPHEILFVADGMTGQDAVNTAREFNRHLEFDGVCLTKLDGDARGGAALSIAQVTKKPIKYIGVGERLDAIELFHPDRMASRILGMGDIVSLVEKTQQGIDEEKARKLEKKLRKAEFTFEDFLEQLEQIKNMGPLNQLLGMIPGFNTAMAKGLQVDEKAFSPIEAIIQSMTLEERCRPHVINGSRRKRIARGSGTTVQQVNQLLRQFEEMKKMMKRLNKLSPNKLSRLGLPF